MYQLIQPHVLTGVLGYNLGYDDGVYLGVATRLVHGVLPYKDFVFVHPPGIAYLMAPVALVGRLIGEHESMVIARCLTVLAVGANAFLAGMILRSRGLIATAVASLTLALWPLTVSVDRTLELEPYLLLFCLIGAYLAFSDGNLARPRRLFLAGLAFGFAGATKVWAILPVAAVILCCLPRWRRGVRPLSLGVATGFIVPCLPFLLLAPGSFFHQVIYAQTHRKLFVGAAPTSLSDRLLLLTGLRGLADSVSSAWAQVFFLVLIAAVIVFLGLKLRRLARVEWFAVTSAFVTFIGMFAAREFYDHYAYFPAAFLALLLGVTASRVVSAIPVRIPLSAVRFVAVPLAVLAISVVVAKEADYGRRYLSEASDPRAIITSTIPKGACVISDFPGDLLVSDRFTPDAPGCPAVIDPYGMYLTDDGGNQPHNAPPYEPAFIEKWFTWLQQADYVELRIPFSHFLPWDATTMSWFNENYQLVGHEEVVYARPFIDFKKDIYVYENKRRHMTATWQPG